jgi:hypothetical protein
MVFMLRYLLSKLLINLRLRADCRQCNGAVVKSLVIDGNRPELLRIKNGGALVEMGNAEGQVVRDCKVLEPR